MNGEANILSVFNLATAAEIAAGLDWYQRAGNESAKLHKQGAAIVAALSPGLRWERNIEAARRVVHGEPLDGLGIRWYDGVRKAQRILAGESPLTVLRGEKVSAFWHCLENPDNRCFVCVDGHAYGIWKGKRIPLDKVPKGFPYHTIAHAYICAADRLGIIPCQLQAITWCTWRRIHGVENGGIGHVK
jgi:hypothetical protein